ncbi:MAG: PEP-CTERM sorting domain-containing protein [Verrucomicrobiae bacterium]|nr:PEP-CTERM sorting domain-containing protein [Verrucomicrobiae bacterium]
MRGKQLFSFSKLVLITATTLLPLSASFAANLASDSADDSAYNDGWQAGDNGGTGFGPWTFFFLHPDLDRNGVFMGSSANNGEAPSGNIDTSGRSWGLYANFTTGPSGPQIGGVSAVRPFTGGELGIGQTLRLAMDNGWVEQGFRVPGAVGFSLNRFSFFFRAGDTEYRVGNGNPADTLGLYGTGIPFTDDGLFIEFTRTGQDTFTLEVKRQEDDSEIYVINGTMPPGGPLDSITLYNRFAGPDSPRDLFFNRLEIIPEPGTTALVVLGLLPALFLRRKR